MLKSALAASFVWREGVQRGLRLQPMRPLARLMIARSEIDRTAISKSTNFSEYVLISLSKQNLYSPASFAVNTASTCRSLLLSIMILSRGPRTL